MAQKIASECEFTPQWKKIIISLHLVMIDWKTEEMFLSRIWIRLVDIIPLSLDMEGMCLLKSQYQSSGGKRYASFKHLKDYYVVDHDRLGPYLGSYLEEKQAWA